MEPASEPSRSLTARYDVCIKFSQFRPLHSNHLVLSATITYRQSATLVYQQGQESQTHSLALYILSNPREAMAMEKFPLRRLSLAGIPIDALSQEDLFQIMENARLKDSKDLILNHNLHSIYLYLTDPDFRALYSKASSIYIDGMPLVWLGKLAGLPLLPKHRITFLDCFHAVLQHAEDKGWRVFYLGSTEHVFSAGTALIKQRYPRLAFSGRNGFISDKGAENDSVISQINAFKTDILFVGMGMPLQEQWLARNLSRVEASSILTCGATLDYITGNVYKPPAWAGPIGLYGLLRLMNDPRRLWTRYIPEPIAVLRRLAIPILRQRLSGSKQQCGQLSKNC